MSAPRTAEEWLAEPRINPWWPFLSDQRAGATLVRMAEIDRLIWARVMTRRGR